jgi:SAM-dependent methyltransferase
MHPRVHQTYQKLAEKYEMNGPFLEIGAGSNAAAILSGSYFQGKPGRFATNLSDMDFTDETDDTTKIQFIRCNSQNMRGVFADGQFATVLCNAVIEHDKYFWRSLDEMKRVLAPGGILAIGAPGYIARRQLKDNVVNDKLKKATITFDLHSTPDYWRFSRMAFKEVICEGLEVLEISVVGRVPVLMAVARMPLTGLLEPVAQEDRQRVLRAEKEVRVQQRAARLQERETEQAAALASLTPEERATKEALLLKREARLAARHAKLQERKAKADAKTPDDGSAKATKSDKREARLQARQAKRQSRKAKPDVEGLEPKTAAEMKLQARQARIQEREAKLCARQAKAEAAEAPESVETEGTNALLGKRKRGREKYDPAEGGTAV